MPNIHRIKSTFTAGEVSPLLASRTDFKRLASGCRTLLNAACLTQGPVRRRSGFEFIFDLTTLGLDPDNQDVRMIPFIFNELQAYALIFFYVAGEPARMVAAHVNGGLILKPDGDVMYVDMPDDFDVRKFDWAQSADEIYFAQEGIPQFTVTRHDEADWTVEALKFSFNGPGDNPWDALMGYPERVTFHQQRLVYASSISRRQTVWLSKAGDFLNFQSTDADTGEITADCAVTFTLDSGTQNKIMWVQSSKALNVGTMGNEWTVTGNDRNALTPENILAIRQTNNGSEPIKPLLIGLATLFVERHGRTTNEFVYDYNYDSYKNADVTILAPHLTEHYSIIDWTFQQAPDGILWCVREDGVLMALTYQREHEVVGWHRHDTRGEIKACTCIPGLTREDDLWVCVSRNIGGVDRIYLERLHDWFTGDKTIEGRFLDSWVVYDGTETDEILGLEHLEGCGVGVLADGAVHPMVPVINGAIQLRRKCSKAVIGFPYTTEIRPYVSDIPLSSGTAVGRMQRITNIDIGLYKSLGMKIGRIDSEDGEYAEDVPFRVPGDYTGEAVPLYTGQYHLSFPEGFDRKVDYFIRQDQPLPLTVLGVVDTVEVFE